MDAREFEDANAACGLLPGPASTQLAIFCAFRVGGARGAIVGGLGFVVPAVVCVLALSVLFLGSAPPLWVRGAGAGAGAAVAAVAVEAARGLLGPSFRRARTNGSRTAWWFAYLIAGAAAASLIGPYLVLVLLGCGAVELVRQRRISAAPAIQWGPFLATAPAAEAWAKQGGFGTGNHNVPSSIYPDAITKATESPIQSAKAVVFDMSDEQPPSFGGTTGQGEWGLFQDFLKSPKNVSGIQTKLEAAATAAYKKGK